MKFANRQNAAIGSCVHQRLIGSVAFAAGPVVSIKKEACTNIPIKTIFIGKYQTPWKARTPAPRRKRFEAGLGLDENLRLEMSLKTTGEIVDR